jgi:hypothetical protein
MEMKNAVKTLGEGDSLKFIEKIDAKKSKGGVNVAHLLANDVLDL